MSNITLYHFPEINNVDTPIFDTISNQRKFFSAIDKYEVLDNSFYVPKFKDVIVFSLEDLTFSSSYNYLSIYFREKYYYYFISSYEYLSETEIRVAIDMDVIQTYMFDIEILSGELVRNSIKRWVDDTHINRNYIRENLSEGIFVQENKKTYLNKNLGNSFSITPSAHMTLPKDNFRNVTYKNRITGLIIVRTSDTLGSIGAPYPAVTDTEMSLSGNIYTGISSSRYALIPVVNGRIPGEQKILMLTTQGTVQHYTPNFRKALSMEIAKDPKVQAIYYVPFQCLDENILTAYDCEYMTSDSEEWVSGTVIIIRQTILKAGGNLIYFMDDETSLLKEKIVKARVGLYKDTFSLAFFQKNSYPTTRFSYVYVPFLLDENYYRVSFGSPAEQATIPLFNCDIDSFTVEYYSDILNGYKYYNIVPSSVIESYSGNLYLQDVNNAIVIDRNVSYLDTLTEAWRNYFDYNKGSFYGAIASSTFSTLTSFAGGAMNYGGYAKEAEGILGNKKAHLYNSLKRRLRPKYAAQYESLYDSAEESLGKGILSGVGSSAPYSQGLNAMFAPTTLRSAGNFSADELIGANLPSLVISHVQDYIECAKYVEENGYKVFELVSGDLQDFNNRYYYDVIKFGKLNVVLNNNIQDDETLRLIVSRLTDGLRLWHTTNGVLNTSATPSLNLRMGQVCVYDNVEVE